MTIWLRKSIFQILLDGRERDFQSSFQKIVIRVYHLCQSRVRGTTCPIMDVTGSPHQIMSDSLLQFCFSPYHFELSQLSLNMNIFCAMIFMNNEFVKFYIWKRFEWNQIWCQIDNDTKIISIVAKLLFIVILVSLIRCCFL